MDPNTNDTLRDILINLEGYNKAYESRKEEYFILKKTSRKVITMHLGGIVVECRIKDLILYKYNINKQKKDNPKCWYGDTQVEWLKKIKKERNNITGEHYNKYKYPLWHGQDGHDLPKLIRDHLKLEISSIQDDLDNVYRPRNIEKENFIDLRYIDESKISDEMYEKWEKSYKQVVRWIENQIENIESEDYCTE